MSSPLKKVNLNADVYMVCLQHALSTENYEVMGLLIGDNVDGETNISAVKILRRSDKKKDRVEISSDQLLMAAAEAERLTEEMNKRMTVVGWYHSHPHITVCPSHVDVGTQAMYQTMEANFIGLIFSVFSEDKGSKEQEILLTCFQSENGKPKEIPLEIISSREISINCMKTMMQLPRILVQEEKDIADNCENHPDILTKVHNNAVYTRALGHVTDIVTRPLVQILHERYMSNKMKIAYVKKEIELLQSGKFVMDTS